MTGNIRVILSTVLNFIAEYNDFLEDKINDSLFESLVVFKLALKESLPGDTWTLSPCTVYI
jgi:hypothetical protein